ncbi:unnamed protein product [Lactuca saligna]|uniref:Uncharacterized protein n=1 Tax=Lactuca saligna TaxID=75948 RepID=A0AA35Z6L3_LACSI|nr:unnamed protein product [Lactuca saligna]
MEHRRISILMYACIILHNMIFEYEGKTICYYNENKNLPNVKGVGVGSKAYMANIGEVYDRVVHHNLHVDLLEHIFNTQMNPVVDDFVEDDLFDDTDDES